jgi:hypothetical protein
MQQKSGNRKRKSSPASGLKALISVGALASTLFGWGLLGKQGLASTPPSPAVDLRGIVEQILGELPTLLPRSTGSTLKRTALRSVTAPSQSSSRPFPITRTQSSR